MSELEKLKEQNPYSIDFASLSLTALRTGWAEGIEAAYDADWREVPSEEEIDNYFANNWLPLERYGKGHCLRQWLLERGK